MLLRRPPAPISAYLAVHPPDNRESAAPPNGACPICAFRTGKSKCLVGPNGIRPKSVKTAILKWEPEADPRGGRLGKAKREIDERSRYVLENQQKHCVVSSIPVWEKM